MFRVASHQILLHATIRLYKNYEAALLLLDTYNSIPNISVNKNNIFTYSTDGGVTWKTVALNTGTYELQAINTEIKRQIITNDDDESALNLSANISRLTSIVTIENQCIKLTSALLIQ